MATQVMTSGIDAKQVLDEDRRILDGLGDFVDKAIVPLENKHRTLLEDQRQLYAPDGRYSKELVDLLRQARVAAAEAGYYTMFAPVEVGGAGLGAITHFRVWEYLYHRYGPDRILPYQAVAHWAKGPSFLAKHFTREQSQVKDRLISGEVATCFAMSEPDAGSDAWAMSTTAVQAQGGWVLNGSKQWITNGPIADYAYVFAVTNRDLRAKRQGGISCFLLPMDTPGVEVTSIIRLFGQCGGNEAVISFSDVEIARSQLVGEEDKGFQLAVAGVDLGRMYNAGRCVGLARWALEQATEYANTREAFGKKIGEHQGVSFLLSDSAIEIYAAKSMALDCAALLQAGKPAARNLAIVKAYCTEMCFQVYDRCIQVLGAMGLANESRMFDGWHQARSLRMADGSAQIMRKNIARSLLRGDLEF